MSHGKILLIDDDDNIRFVAEMSLEEDWTVVTASSGVEGIALAKEEKPDVILLDYMMPSMDGSMTLAKLREIEECRQIPIIFMTAKVQPQEVQSYVDLGVAGLIVKPFDPMTLSEQIKHLSDSPKQSAASIARDTAKPEN